MIEGVEQAEQIDQVTVFQAGTDRQAGELVTAGGRVLAVSAVGADLPHALKRAYAGVKQISFAGAHYRTDIGATGGAE